MKNLIDWFEQKRKIDFNWDRRRIKMIDTRKATVEMIRRRMEMESLPEDGGGHEVGITSSRQILGCG